MKHPTLPTIPTLPKKSLLRRFMPDDYRYGDVYGYTEAQMRDYANKSVNLVLNDSNLEIERLQKILEQIASLSHCGGLLGLSETGALTEIRNLSFEFWKEYKHER